MDEAGSAHDVVTRPRVGQLLGLAWPIVVSRAAQVVVSFTDAAMVAPLGKAAFAATVTGAMNTFLVFILMMGTVFIVSSFSSQLSAKGDHAGARRFGIYGLCVALGSELICLAFIPFVAHALGLFALDLEVRELMTTYVKLRLVGGGAAVGLEALSNYYAGTKNTVLPMAMQIVAMVVNVGLNWVLIYGKLGAPALGVAGASLASTISTVVAFLVFLGCFVAKVGAPKVRAGRLQIRELGRMLRYGVPSGLNWAIEFGAFIFFVDVVVAGLGTTTLSAMMAVMQINSISFMPAFAIASAGSVFVGQAIGAKRHDDVPHTVGLTLRAAAVWQGVVGLLYLAMPGIILAPFAGDDDRAAFLAIGGTTLMISSAWQLFDAAANTYAEALRASGDTSFTFWARSAIAWLVFVPGTLIGTRWFGQREVGATVWLVLYLVLLGLVLWLRFRTGRWRTLEITEPAPV